jgi:trimeric autotransporter adhesin
MRMCVRGSSLLLAGLVAGALAGCGKDNGDNPPLTPSPAPLPTPDSFLLTSTNKLVGFQRNAPDARGGVTISGLMANDVIVGMDIRPFNGELILVAQNGTTGRLYVVNTTTGVATLRATLAADPADASAPYAGLTGVNFGVDFNPVPDALRVVSDTGQNLRINPTTGLTTTDGTLSATLGGAARAGISAAAYTNAFGAACRTQLYYIDAVADQLVTTTAPNDGVVTTVGSLGTGINADAVNGFEIFTASDGANTALAVINVGGLQNFYTINLTTGAATLGGAFSGLTPGETVRAVASLPPTVAPTQTIGELVALTETGRMVSVLAATPQKACTDMPVTGLVAGEALVGIDLRPADGNIYGVGTTGRLYTVNPATGVATTGQTLVADPTDLTAPYTALSGARFGVDFNPAADRLRVVSNTGQNLRINVTNGQTNTDTDLNPTGSTVTSAAYTDSFAGTGATFLYVLDVANARLQVQGAPTSAPPPNPTGGSGNPNNGDLLTIGTGLGVTPDPAAASGFDINGLNNQAFAALSLAGGTTSGLYSVNLTAGTATLVNTIAGGSRVRGLAFTARPVATVFGVTTTNRLVTFSVTAPGTLITNNPITGLAAGENIIGVDFRPANGMLYAATNQARVYVINTTTFAAATPVTLAVDPADLVAPTYAALTGTAFGVDFNPVPDRLRIVSDARQNLRINVANGLTQADVDLSAGFNINSAAYTNSFAPAPTGTTLYVLDATANGFVVQGLPPSNPNNGDLTQVGLLTNVAVTPSSPSGFDIVGGANGLSLAALQPTGATQSSLYRINLNTGVATLVGAIGPANTLLVGLAIRLQ